MPRPLSVAVLVFSLVLDGCASSLPSVQPDAPVEQRIVWDPPPEAPKGLLRNWYEGGQSETKDVRKGRFLTWCTEHPWKAGIAATCFVVGSLPIVFVGALAYGLAHSHGNVGPG